jgi:RNA polymerase sigma factor (sigma-70 family)
MRSTLVAYAARLIDPDTAEDLVQEAFVRAMETGRPDLDTLPLSYFKTIVHNLAMDLYWKRSRDRDVSTRLTQRSRDHAHDPLQAERAALDADIQDRLTDLSQRQWESVMMTVVKGLTERQAASAADVSRSAVTGSRDRALQQLRDAAPAEPRLARKSLLTSPEAVIPQAHSYGRLAG